MKIPIIEVIFFDFGGVLAEEGFRKGLASLAHLNGLPPEPFVKTAFEITFGNGFVIGKSDENTFWQTLRKRTGIVGSDRALRNEILPRFELRVWMLNLIKKLRKSSIRSAILSDQTNWLDELEAQYNFFKWFDRVFNSYHLGKSKKDPTLFDDVVDEMGTIPERALFVDDDRGNIERAGQKGLHAIHYQNRQAFEHDLFSFFPFLKTVP